MGGAVTPVTRTPAEYTVLLLQQAAHGGSPVLIPGAREVSAVRPAARPSGGAETQTTLAAQTSVVSDRERLELEREGGGAPSERGRGHRASFLARLWRSMPNISVDPPRVHVAGSDAHDDAHDEAGPHVLPPFLAPDVDYPRRDIDGPLERLKSASVKSDRR
jgi:hypothetical protein